MGIADKGASMPDEDSTLKAHLHHAFDHQIPNFGSYNLVYATGRAGEGGKYIVGYRRHPMEIIVAPLHAGTLASLEPATSINLTNLSHLAEDRAGGHEVGTSTGRVFRFEVASETTIDAPPSANSSPETRVHLKQHEDAADFSAFFDEFLTLVAGFGDTEEPAAE
ncbi:hypothetical protein JTF08_05775 [Micrococcaceae bacterium RIT802]|nr:hypothetical protein [Micrococcaceae bacterium RIT 802]